jgi:very-short-patch-repair endonuclease
MIYQTAAPEKRQRLAKLFEFLKAYTDMRFPAVREIAKQPKHLWLKDLPSHPSLELFQQLQRSETAEDSDVVLRLTRPTITPCPTPPRELTDWLKPGWKEVGGRAEARESRNVRDKDGNTLIEQFTDARERPLVFQTWKKQRDQWAENERPARDSLVLFQQVYEWYGINEREGERVELIVGDGIIRCGAADDPFHHPVLLQKLELEFYPEKKTPQFVFRRQERPPELYMELLRAVPQVDTQQLARCANELKETEFSPLGEEDTTGCLRRLVQGLFPKNGSFLDHATSESANSAESASTDPSETSVPKTIERSAVIFMRNRRTGPSNIFDLVLEDIAVREEFPAALLQILGFTEDAPNQPDAAEPVETSFDFGDEDHEILFSKPANAEQLKIARQLERKNCVLVQGPPGTGKTHTIANLLGHLLAQGKRVLVTAHTPKALRVLREKVVEPLRPLCISVLQNDKKSQEELQASVRKIHQRLSDVPETLERESAGLRRRRNELLDALRRARKELLDARLSETLDVVYGGMAERPIDAAKRVKEGVGKHDWIPAPINLGEVLPLSAADLGLLYQTSARVSQQDERELEAVRPEVSTLPSPGEFWALTRELKALSQEDLRFREELWADMAEPQSLQEFDHLLALAGKTIDFFQDSASWKLEAIQAGRDGGDARHMWQSFVEMIEITWQDIAKCHVLVVEHGPSLEANGDIRDDFDRVEAMLSHLEKGGSFGFLTKLTKRDWSDLIERARVSGRALKPEDPNHLRAVRALLRVQICRQELLERWDRLMTTQGAPFASTLGDKPEQVCRQFVLQIHSCLDWHQVTWLPLENNFERVGFRWSSYLQSTIPEIGANAELNRVRKAVLGELGQILRCRSCFLRHRQLVEQLNKWLSSLGSPSERDARATRSLREAVQNASADEYERCYEELIRLKQLEPEVSRRYQLIERLTKSAPNWASVVYNRVGKHGQEQMPGDPTSAWEWRQFHDELERRASVSLEDLQQRIENINEQLLSVTADLIDKQTWLNQIRQTTGQQHQALGAYAALRNKLSKTGTGKLDKVFLAEARKELAAAKDAVPVWIMPLNEVADAFDPRKIRFDVVIIDEASQCDPCSMFALYLGKQTIIVGDDEQVTPLALGVEATEMLKLIETHLEGIPHKVLYGGDTSIYELAQMAFGGGVIRLVEHFRCAPNIIAFSNDLSYGSEIKPLREASAIPLRQHVLPYRLADASADKNNVNEKEAETIAALICAAAEHPAYAKNELGKPATFGVVSLVSGKQTLKIDAFLRQRLEPAEYQRRQILCGDPAQFQGDERDVMFLSVVDSTPQKSPLPMKQEGQKKIYKKRFNVAASRARNQMWVVYSLNHETDLQLGDYRRRLIEHAIDPEAWERELRKRMEQTESVFEERVLKCLMGANYNVQPQFKVGAYRIDLVVTGNGRRLAVECDGERFHGTEKLQEDMARQAILERLGWKFVRIRGSLFFRDEAVAMASVFRRLNDLNITPELKIESPEPSEDQVTEEVKRRAQELRTAWRAAAEANKEERLEPLPAN